MNARSFKVIFSKRLGALVAVGEHASAQGKRASGEGARGAALAAAVFLSGLSSAYALDPSALPSGHQVTAGQVQVTTSGARMDIGQLTNQAIVNWQSFNVGSGAAVHIQQPNASSVLLNRVVGNDMSQIRGQISANGQVVLVNPNGIVMGPTGRITASAFTASTFGISDANFLAGKLAFERNGSDASLVNEGSIQTTGEAGGYVALIGAEVSNEGTIQTRQGAVFLAAADAVSVPLSRNVRLEITPAAFGKASVSNRGVIQTEGGQVFMRAAAVVDAISKIADARVSHTGSIDTSGAQGGRVDILADHGTVRVSGSVTANSTDGAVGGKVFIGRDEQTNTLAAVGDASGARLESKGGFVETSGKFLNVDGTRVMAKEWLLDPDNIDITGDATAATAGYSKIKASDIVANLNIGTSVVIATSSTAGTGLNQPAYVGSPVNGDGNILVNAVISKTLGGEASLTLLADNGITVNQEIKSTSNKLNVTMKANGSASGASSQGLVINKSIDANGGAINLEGKTTNSAAAVTVASTAVIRGASVTMVGNSTSGAAIKGTGKVNATAGGVSITGVGNTTGDYAITTNNTIDATGDILISTTSAALHGIAIREKVTSSGGKVDLYADVRTSGNGSAMNGNFAIKAKNDVTITGKSNGYYSVNGLGAIESTDGKVTIEATSSASSALRLTNTVKAKGHVLITGTGHNDSGINTGATTTVTSTDGDVELVGKTTGSGVGVNLSGTTTISATQGTVKVTAESASAQGMVFQGTTTINAATYNIQAEAKGGAAGLYQGSGPTTFTSTAGNSSIKGTSASGRGVFVQSGVLNFNANNGSTTTFSSGKGEMRLGFGGGVTVNTHGLVTLGSNQSNFFSQADKNVNSGTLTITGKSAGQGVAIQDGSGFSTDIFVKNGSNLVIVGESTGSGSGIHLLPQGVANKIEMTGSQSDGTQGTITMVGVSASGVGITTGSTPITSDGGNITLTGTSNGTNGTGLSLGGVIRSGNDTSGGTVTLNGTAHGSGSSVGINNSGSVQGGSVDMTGVAKGTNNAIFSASSGSITATTNTVNIKGTNTNAAANGGGGTTLHGTVTAQSTVNLEGYSAGGANQGLVIQNAVESKGGDINVTGETKAAAQRAVAINALSGSVFGGLKVADGKNITINANTLLLAGAATVVDAGANGTVNIKTRNNNEIVVGGFVANDSMATTLANQQLGLDQTELNRIKAGSLVMGDASSTGKITVAAAAITAETTGNITLQTQGDIDFAASLTTGGFSGNKKLSLRSDGAINGTAAGVITTKELDIYSASGALDDNPEVDLSLATHQIGQVFGQTQAFNLRNGRALIVGSSSDDRGLGANGNVTIESTSTGSGAGIHVKEFINTPIGHVSLTGTSATGNGVHIAKDVQTQDGRVTITGTSNGSAAGVLAQTAVSTDSLNIMAPQGVAIEGSSADGIGVNLESGFLSADGTHDFGAGNAIHVKGSTGTDSDTVAGVRLNNQIDNWSTSGGTIVIEATQGALVSTADAQINQNANANVELSTNNLGDLSTAKINKRSEGAGDIILSAGKTLTAGDGTGGQVKPVDGNTITNAGTGKLLVYTGNTNDTGMLNQLSSAFDTLYASGIKTSAGFNQNFGATLSNEAKAQVLFRQTAAPTVTGSLATAEYSRGYNGQTVAQNGDWPNIKEALKGANPGEFTNGVGSNTFGVSKSDVIDALALDATSQAIANVKRDSNNNVVSHLLAFDTAGLDNLPGFALASDSAAPTLLIQAVAPAPNPEPFIPVTPEINPNVVVTVSAANNNFQLAGAEGQCSADTLALCECEGVINSDGSEIEGIQLCYEP